MSISTFTRRFFSRDVMLMLLMIMISPQALVFGNNSIHLFITVTNLFAILFAAYIFQIKSLDSNRSLANSSLLAIMAVLMIVTGLVASELSLEYIVRLFYFISAIFFVRKFSFKRFVDTYLFVMLFLGVWSIMTVLIGNVAGGVISKCPVVSTFQGWDYYCTGFANYPAFIWKSFRLMGPFREPGVTQIFFNLAITFYLFFNDKYNWKALGILILAVVLTFSTTGYIVLAINFGYYWIKRQRSSSSFSSILLLVFLVSAAIGAIMYTSYSLEDSIVFSKFYDEENDSVTSRFGSIIANWELIKLNPLIGNGLLVVEELFSKLSLYKGVTSEHNTNTILVQFASFGVVYGSLFILLIWRFAKIVSFSALSRFFVFLMICLSLSGEDISRCLILFILLAYGADYKQQISNDNA